MSEEFSYWRYAKDHVWENFEDCRPFRDMASAAASHAASTHVPPDKFGDQLYRLFDAYSSLLSGTNKGHEPDQWHHWYNKFPKARLGKKFGEPYLSAESISDAASIYLNGALRVPKMDRALLDALIAQETFAYIDRRAGAGAMLTNLGCFVAIVIVTVAWQLLTGESVNWNRLMIGGGVILGLIVIAYLWPRKGMLKLHGAMRETYHLMSGSVVSVPELRRSVEKARDVGVVWPPELFAVLDDVESRTKVL